MTIMASGHRAVLVLVSSALALLTVGWIFGTPPGAGPDEGAHYVRALGVGQGDPVGAPFEPSREQIEAFEQAVREAQRTGEKGPVGSEGIIQQDRLTRVFSVPRELSSFSFGCNVGRAEVSAACYDQPSEAPTSSELPSNTGTYQPFPYVLSGLAMPLASTPESALITGRVAMAFACVLLLTLAAFLLFDPVAGSLSVIGLVVAATPMVVFSSSVLSASGPETAAAICLVAGLIRLTRGGSPAAWIWWAVGLSGGVLAVSRSLGPLFVLLAILAVTAVQGAAPLREIARAAPSRVRWTAGVVVVACAAGLYWELAYQPHVSSGVAELADEVGPSFSVLPVLLRQAVGNFGSLDSPLPTPAYVVWLALLVGLGGTAVVAGSRRQRIALAVLVVGAVAVTVLLSVLQRTTGFGLQGRHVLPVLVAVPLLAGEVVRQYAERIHGAWLGRWVTVSFFLAAAVHGLAWLANARRFAVGNEGSWLFPTNSEWAPAGSWLPWLAVVSVACLLLAWAGALGTRRTASPGADPAAFGAITPATLSPRGRRG